MSAEIAISGSNADALSTLFGDKDKTVNLTISEGHDGVYGGPPKIVTSARSGMGRDGQPRKKGESPSKVGSMASPRSPGSSGANPFTNDHLQRLK
jgi:hypothetical protein